ncbi:MAG: hypothetical protein LCH58_11380 [Bacteroidetes bacterium]|jgi:hypothetical protein|uniref:hypothetical protein n=1 Tax=Phnomibacter sp. TaxID=2836217 RepID=UPI002FDCFBA8|nr:hypothetical protein [Bacteroidota bacterium]
MWQRATTNWNFIRFIRLALGIMVIVQSIQFREYWFVFFGVLLAVLAILDMGCASGACGVPPQKQTQQNTKPMEEITYEEVGK